MSVHNQERDIIVRTPGGQEVNPAAPFRGHGGVRLFVSRVIHVPICQTHRSSERISGCGGAPGWVGF